MAERLPFFASLLSLRARRRNYPLFRHHPRGITRYHFRKATMYSDRASVPNRGADLSRALTDA
jgi:hypothetical protein